MKIEPQLPPQPEPLKQDRGCAFALVIVLLLFVVGATVAWILLWSGGHRDADKEQPAPQSSSLPVLEPHLVSPSPRFDSGPQIPVT